MFKSLVVRILAFKPPASGLIVNLSQILGGRKHFTELEPSEIEQEIQNSCPKVLLYCHRAALIRIQHC